MENKYYVYRHIRLDNNTTQVKYRCKISKSIKFKNWKFINKEAK